MIRAIIVDDEPLALQLLEKKLNEVGGVEVIRTFFNAETVLNEMENLYFQVAFLDIEMAGLSGLNLAEQIQQWNSHIHIVFVTAYRDYAVQAFELDSIDYLLKPVLNSRLEKTIARIQEHIQMSKSEVLVNNRPARSSLSVICFEEFSVYSQEELVKWKTVKVKELFAFFITHINTYINRDTIIEHLWPEHDYKKAKILLHTCLSHLRKTLDSIGFKGAITFSSQSYILQLDHFYCDAIELEQAIDDHPVIDSNNIQLFERVIPNYTGDYMEKNAYEWATAKAETIKQKYFQLLQKMNNYYTQCNELEKKQQCLHLLLTCNPYSDKVIQQLMLHYSEVGDRGEAIKIYQEFANLLEEDLGILPDYSTQDLYQTIRDN